MQRVLEHATGDSQKTIGDWEACEWLSMMQRWYGLIV
jgi:hypothetical protein